MKQNCDIYETTYHVHWTELEDFGADGDYYIWKANFTDEESYIRFVSQDNVVVLEVSTTQR